VSAERPRRSWWAAPVAALVVFGVYVATVAPDLTWAHWGADGGDFVTAAATGRIPHPPGFPLYVGLAGGFVRLPWGTPAWRLHLLSAVAGGGAVGVVVHALLASGLPLPASLVGGLTLGLARLFWSQAVIAEVYTTAALWGALLLWWRLRPGSAPWWPALGGLLWGLGLAVHPLLLFWAPLLLLEERTVKGWSFFVGGLLLGLSPYAGLPLRGPWPQPWGDMGSFTGWWQVVSARLYWGYAFRLPLEAWPRRGLALLSLLARQFTPLGALLVIVGGTRMPKREWLPVVATILLTALYALGYNTADSLVYLLLIFPLLAYLLALGLSSLEGRFLSWAAVLLPVVLLLWNWSAVDLSGDLAARHWWEGVLKAAPPEAVLFTSEDAHTFTLWYALEVVGTRPDVQVVDEDLWSYAPYWAFMTREEDVDIRRLAGERPLCEVESAGVSCR
jgi:hypothetical protein